MSATIRTDTRANAINDLSDARIRGEELPKVVALDDCRETLYVKEVEPGQWEAQSDSGACYPL